MAHLLKLHGHSVGYLPPTYSSEIMYDSNTTEKEKIDEKAEIKYLPINGNTDNTGNIALNLSLADACVLSIYGNLTIGLPLIYNDYWYGHIEDYQGNTKANTYVSVTVAYVEK